MPIANPTSSLTIINILTPSPPTPQQKTMPYQPTQPPLKALIIGISGPSSSGKTTLARLLQRIFCGVSLDGSSGAEIRAQTQTQTQGTQGDDGRGQKGKLNTFIIHEDDFYFPDDQYVSPSTSP